MIPGVTASQKRTPFDLIPWLHAFWASDPLWSNPGDGNAVSSWRNGGSNGTAATQATVGLRPIYQSSVAIMNNRPAVVFDGSDDALSLTGISISRPLSLVAIVRFNRIGNPERAITVTTGNNSGMGHGSGNNFNLTMGNSGINTSQLTTNVAPYLEVGYVDTSSMNARIEVNGTLLTTGAVAVTAADRILLGNGNVANRSLLGELAFAGIYSGDIVAHANYPLFKRWVSSYYNIVIA